MRTRFFWGILLIFIGCAFILNRLFYIDIPIFNLILPLIIIFWGITMIFQGPRMHHVHTNTHDFDEIKAESTGDRYEVIFGNRTMDLTSLHVPERNRLLYIDTKFGQSIVRINPAIPAVIKGEAAFANIRFPNDSAISFGESTYYTSSYKEGIPHLYIKCNTVFGQTDIIEC